MVCPACQAPLAETDPVCGTCGFSLAVADQMFGIPPQLSRPVHDLTGSAVTKRQIEKLSNIVRRIERRFPQAQPAVVFSPSCDPSPLSAKAFWLFNRAALFSASDSGGGNFGVLLLIDTDQSKAAAMTGYGLESWMPDDALSTCLEAQRPSLAEHNFFDAASSFLVALLSQFESTLELSSRAFGLAENDIWVAHLHELTGQAITPEY